MNRILASLALAAFAAPVASAASLKLTIANVETGDGTLMIAVFDGQDSWTGDTAAMGVTADPETGRVSVTLDGLSPGEIGLKLFHDTDGDGDLDTGNLGIPSEPYGFSNDAPVRFGPPSWDKAKFTIVEGVNAHAVTLR